MGRLDARGVLFPTGPLLKHSGDSKASGYTAAASSCRPVEACRLRLLR